MSELIDNLHELFDIAWELNKSENTRTALTQKITTYLPGVVQDLVYYEKTYSPIEVRYPIDMNGEFNYKVPYCYRCGTNLKDVKYCPNCGSALIWGKHK